MTEGASVLTRLMESVLSEASPKAPHPNPPPQGGRGLIYRTSHDDDIIAHLIAEAPRIQK